MISELRYIDLYLVYINFFFQHCRGDIHPGREARDEKNTTPQHMKHGQTLYAAAQEGEEGQVKKKQEEEKKVSH